MFPLYFKKRSIFLKPEFKFKTNLTNPWWNMCVHATLSLTSRFVWHFSAEKCQVTMWTNVITRSFFCTKLIILFSMSNETKRFSFNIWNEHQKHLTSQFEVIFVPLRFDLEEQFSQPHPEKLTWNITMEVWKVIFLSKWLIGRFQPLIFQGVLSLECLRKTLRPFELLPCPADQVGVVEEIIAGSRCRPFKCPTFFSKANKPQ